MLSSEKISKAGDVLIEKIQILTSQGFYQDISAQVIAVTIYEDIFSPFISGTLEVRDSLDLLNVFPLNGEEFLDLKVSTPTLESGNIDSRFYIYKMSNRTMMGDRTAVYTLSFISQEAILDLNNKLSRSFEGKCSDIAKTVINELIKDMKPYKPMVIEETSNSTKFISNFWSPVRCINDVSETAINTNGSASYLFFENRHGFNFVSLELLYNSSIYQTFIYDNYVRDTQINSLQSIKNVEEDYKRIRNITVPVQYDYIDRARSGMYGSRLFTYDIMTKRVVNKSYDALKNHNTQKHLNKFPLISDNARYKPESLMLNMTKYTGNFTGYGDVTNTSSIQNRISLLAHINANKIELTIPGRMDYTVGLRVNLKLFKNEPNNKEDTEILDEMLSGSYIISAISHYINRDRHECIIEVVKESLLLNLNRK